jgi:hypothetical protein
MRRITHELQDGVGHARGCRDREAGCQGIHAQAKPPAYYIAEIDVKNEDVFSKEWAPKADETIKAAGGAYVVRSTTSRHRNPCYVLGHFFRELAEKRTALAIELEKAGFAP